MAATIPADETLALPRTLSRRRAARSIAEVVPMERLGVRAIPAWEWGLTVLTLFVLSRSPVLFYRERIGELIGADPASPLWPDDPAVRTIFAVALGAMYVLAARRCEPKELLRQPFLIAFLVMCFASITWSVEPTVSLWRVALFTGTAAVGFYLGERYSAREIVGIVGAVAAIGALTSLVALAVWPEAAQATRGVNGIWSGVYVNRNFMGIVMASGLLTLPFLWVSLPSNRRPALIAIGAVELFLLIKAGSRTSELALAAAAVVGVALVGVRRATTRSLKPFGGAFAVSLIAGYVALLVQWNWETIVEWLGRTRDLTGRTLIWSVDSYYSDLHPWKGWGFEAIWAHPPTIAVTEAYTGFFPYSSHSGYYEVLLSTGRIGLILFVAFLAVAAWRAFRFAWDGLDSASIWPLVYLVFVVVANTSESLFVSSEAVWALTVAAAVCATRAGGRRRTLS